MRTANYDGEVLYTAFRRDLYEMLGLETVWLSPTPHIADSRFEKQSGCPRFCVMLYLRNKLTGFRFRVFNIHLGHISPEARALGMQATFDYVDREGAKEDLPYVILGDFNAEPDDAPILLANAHTDVFDLTKDIPYTFHGFGTKQIKIDYIYATAAFEHALTKIEPWNEEYSVIYLSDHYPISTEFDV